MQITEVTELGVRSAAITLSRDDSALEFLLLPMIHFAAPTFYAEVRRRLKKCAVIVSEGVAGPTLQSNAMDFANRYFPRGHQHGIVGQTEELVLPAGIPVIRPDVDPAVPALDLRNVPGLRRLAPATGINLALVTSAHVISTALAIAGPRVLCDKDLEIHDFPFTAREQSASDSEFVHALTDARDRKLLQALTDVHEERRLEPIKVGVVYGAGHIPAVSNGLADRYRYRPRKAEWMTVYAG
ncbi:MAG TPA: hypothetical protein VFN97_28050 [Actinospica sp.]|nr:hypothetical protein [Actinospica sp.]